MDLIPKSQSVLLHSTTVTAVLCAVTVIMWSTSRVVTPEEVDIPSSGVADR